MIRKLFLYPLVAVWLVGLMAALGLALTQQAGADNKRAMLLDRRLRNTTADLQQTRTNLAGLEQHLGGLEQVFQNTDTALAQARAANQVLRKNSQTKSLIIQGLSGFTVPE